MYWAFALFGLSIAALEVLAARSNRVTRASGVATQPWLSIYQARWIWGLSPALLSLFVIYPFPLFSTGIEKFQVAGFPFIVGVFGQHGRDFVSSPEIAIFALAANAVTWFFLPSLFLWVWSVYNRRHSRSVHA